MSEHPKAEIGKRLVAGIIDAVIAFVVGFIPVIGGIIATIYWLLRDGLELDFMNHRSIGKHVMKLKVVTLDGSPIDAMVSVKRNWPLAVGGVAQFFAGTIVGILLAILIGVIALALVLIELILVLTDPQGRRIGDKVADTQVIEAAE